MVCSSQISEKGQFLVGLRCRGGQGLEEDIYHDHVEEEDIYHDHVEEDRERECY